MPNALFDMWQKSMSAWQKKVEDHFNLCSAPAGPEEFSVMSSTPDSSITPEAVLIFVEGEWLSLEQFIARFKTMRDNEE